VLLKNFRQLSILARGEEKMPSVIVHISKKEFVRLVSTAVEQKLVELFGDPDDGLVLKEGLRKRLIRQRKSIAKGDRGSDFIAVRKQLGL
jgi:hypothetical protein